MQYTQQMGIGYIGWSWSGNGSCCVPLDIVQNWNSASLSTWGNYLINSSNGIKATSKLATIFTNGSASSVATSSSSKSSSSVASSVVSSVKSSASSSLSSSSSVVSGEQCNWYGQIYPVCTTTTSGWGYENNKSCVARTSCAAQPAPYGIIGATSSAASSLAVSSSSKSSSSIASSSGSKSSVASSVISASYAFVNFWHITCFANPVPTYAPAENPDAIPCYSTGNRMARRFVAGRHNLPARVGVGVVPESSASRRGDDGGQFRVWVSFAGHGANQGVGKRLRPERRAL